MSRAPRIWRRWLVAGGVIVLILLFFVLGGFGYFFGTAAHQRHEVVLPLPDLLDLGGDLLAVYGKYTEDEELSAGLVDPAFAAIRPQLEGVRVILVSSWLSDSDLPSVSLGNSLGYMAGIYNWLGEAGLVAEFADVEIEDTVAANAVRAHSLYVSEKRHAVEVNAMEEKHLVAWLSRRLQNEIVVSDLSEKGHQLVGGWLFPASDAGLAAQFMCETEGDERITIYIEQHQSGYGSDFRFNAYDGVSAFWWQDGPLAYVLIGTNKRGELLALAQATRRQFTS